MIACVGTLRAANEDCDCHLLKYQGFTISTL
jgi:hypothetical protein